jgi:multiple sugar transport system substrate-binding protein
MSQEAFSRRTLIAGGMAVGVGALLAACTPQSTAGGGGGGTAKTGRIRFMSNHSAQEAALFQKAADDYMAAHPKVTIDYLNIADLTSYQTKMKTLATTDQLPDVFYTRTAEIASQGKEEWNLDLTKYAKAHADVEDLWKAQRVQMTYKGKLLGLPYDFSDWGIYYNKTMFQQAGVPLPTSDDLTWSDLFEIARKFRRGSGSQQTQWGLALRFDEWLWWGILDAFGGALLSKDQKRCTASKPANVKALQAFLELYADGTAPLTSATTTSVDPFVAGKCAMQIYGSWAGQSRRDGIGTAFEWDVVKLPKGPAGRRSIVPNGGSWGVSAATKSPSLAQDFCTFLAAPAQQRSFIVEPLRGIAGRPSLIPEEQKLAAKVAPANFSIFADELKDDALNVSYPDYWDSLIASWTTRVKTLTDPKDAEAALQGVENDVNQAIF